MSVPEDDRGLLLGDGLFETVLCDGGELKLLDQHVARLQAGAETLGLPAPDAAAVRRTAEAAVADAGLGAARAGVRITYTAGSGARGLDRPEPPRPRLFAAASASPRQGAPLAVIVAEVRRNAHSPASRLKTLAYLDNVLARRQARQAGADEALMLNGAGQLACAAAANLFWLKGDRLFTPALECGVLAGVMRAQVLARAAGCGLQPEEVRTGPAALDRAEAMFLTNSLFGVRAVGRLAGRAFAPHPAVDRLAQAVRDLS